MIVSAFSWVPVYVNKDQTLAVMSIAFLLNNKDDAVVWRGPKKNGTCCITRENVLESGVVIIIGAPVVLEQNGDSDTGLSKAKKEISALVPFLTHLQLFCQN